MAELIVTALILAASQSFLFNFGFYEDFEDYAKLRRS